MKLVASSLSKCLTLSWAGVVLAESSGLFPVHGFSARRGNVRRRAPARFASSSLTANSSRLKNRSVIIADIGLVRGRPVGYPRLQSSATRFRARALGDGSIEPLANERCSRRARQSRQVVYRIVESPAAELGR